jgi:hypothetical protein
MLILFLHRNGFWIDELYTLHSIRLPWRDMVMERLRRGHFPGYFALAKLVYQPLSGIHPETVLRGLSVAAWLGAVGSFAALAVRFLSGPSAGAAVILLGLNSMVIRQAGEARMYALVLLVAVWILRAYLELTDADALSAPGSTRDDQLHLDSQNFGRWRAALVLLIPLGMAISATTGLLVIGIFYDALRRIRQQSNLLRSVLPGAALGAIVFVPGAILHLRTSDRLGIAGTNAAQILAHLVTVFSGIQAEDDYFAPTHLLRYLQLAGALLTIVLLVRLAAVRAQLPPVLRTCARVTFVPFVLMLVVEITSAWTGLRLLGPPRYLIAVVPAAALLVASLLLPLFSSRYHAYAVQAALAGFLLLGAYGIQMVRTEPFRERVQRMRSEWFRRGDAVACVPAEIADGIEMYCAPYMKVEAAINRFEQDPAVIARQLSPLRSRKHVLLVYYRAKMSPVLHVADALFGPALSNRPDKPVGNLRIFRYRPELAGIEDQ